MIFTASSRSFRGEYWLKDVRSGKFYWYKEGYNSLFEDGSYKKPVRITEKCGLRSTKP